MYFERRAARGRRLTLLLALAPMAAALGSAHSAAADATLTVQLRATFAPVTEMGSVRTWLVAADRADAKAVNQEYVASVSDDFIGGVRVAQFLIPMDALLTTLPVEVSVEVFGPSGQYLDGSQASMIMTNQSQRVFAAMSSPGCSPVAACASSPDYSCARTFFTSEELPPSLCPGGMAASGLRCDGSFCDNVRIDCSPVSGGLGPAYWTPFFSDEDAKFLGCSGTELVTGIECSGAFCDNIRLRCQAPFATLTTCDLTAPVSEEKNTPYWGGRDHFLHRIRCSGSNCDDKILEVCSIRERVWTLSTCESSCLSVAGWSGGPVATGTGLELGACRSAEAGANTDQRWQLTDDGQISNPDLDLCLSPGDQGLPPTLQACASGKPLWMRDPLDPARAVSFVDPALCLTVGIAGEPGQLPPPGTPLRLEPCDGGLGEQFTLPAAPSAPLIPVLSIGGLIALCTSLGIVAARRRQSR